MPDRRQSTLERSPQRTEQLSQHQPSEQQYPTGFPAPDCLPVLGVPVDRLDRRAARAAVLGLARRPGHDVVAFVNAHALNVAAGDERYRAALGDASLVLNDGLGLAVAGRLEGAPFPANLNGTDLLPLVLSDLAAAGQTVFFYGAAPGVAQRTAAHWERRVPGLRVAGSLDGFTVSGAAAAEIIRASDAHVVLVALGNPRQEIWAQQLGARTGARLTIGVGAFFDFSAGVVRRAPWIVRRMRLEWAFRLVQEPRRLAGRYLVGIPAFLGRVAVARVRPLPARPLPARPAAVDRLRHPSAGWSELLAAIPHDAAGADVVVRGPWARADGDVERAG